MKRIFAVFVLFVALTAAPAFGETGGELSPIVVDVLRNWDFFARPRALGGYEDDFLNSNENAGNGL